jgi:hypothetical protein
MTKSISGVPVPNGEALPAQKEIDDMSEPSDFGTFGRYVETPVGQMSPEMATRPGPWTASDLAGEP